MWRRYKERVDGEGFAVPLGKIYRIRCCDCGLVHDVVWVVKDGELGMAVARNNRATAQSRRAIARDPAKEGEGP